MEVRFQLELFAHTDETDLTHEQLSDLSEHIVELFLCSRITRSTAHESQYTVLKHTAIQLFGKKNDREPKNGPRSRPAKE